MITPRVDKKHHILGFIHRWLEIFSYEFEEIVVVTMRKGAVSLPDNVQVIEVKGLFSITKISRLCYHLFKNIKKVEGVLAHMYPFFALIAFPYAKVYRKKLALWYVHKSINPYLILANKIVDVIFTASNKSLRLRTSKKRIIGHGIDTELFKHLKAVKEKKVISVGRISRIKNYEYIIEVWKKVNMPLEIIGPVYDEKYYKELIAIIKKEKLNEKIKLITNASFEDMPYIYNKAYLYVSTSKTGSLDKTTMEAMACELPILTNNEAFLDILPRNIKDMCYFETKNELLKKIKKIEKLKSKEYEKLGKELRKIIVKDHSLKALASKIKKELQG